uniref:Proline rich 5 like n=1 Tax=Equus caballus TaxID=9796 RepID=A0A9L0RRI7_HORSE
ERRETCHQPGSGSSAAAALLTCAGEDSRLDRTPRRAELGEEGGGRRESWQSAAARAIRGACSCLGRKLSREDRKLFPGRSEASSECARLKNQLLAKGLLFVEEKIKLCEGDGRIEVLAEVWDHFFTETLPTLQAIFYPVQGQELTIRQISLLGFRDLVLLKGKLGDLLLLAPSKLPSSIVQMLLILQSVHEPTGPSEGYLQLEELVKQVVSPFLGISEDRGVSGPTFTLARRHSRVHPKVTLLNYTSPVTTVSRPLNEMALTPLTEQEGEAYLEKCGSVRRHTVANAHSDIQLLAMATMMHSGLGEEPGIEDQHLLLPPSFSPPHRQCSSEPNITDSTEELGEVAAGSQEGSELNCASLG